MTRNENTCVSCGAPIPEGIQYCAVCYDPTDNGTDCDALTIYCGAYERLLDELHIWRFATGALAVFTVGLLIAYGCVVMI